MTDFQQAMSGPGSSLFGGAAAAPVPKTSSAAAEVSGPASYFSEPPDSVVLGRSSWTFLHTLAAYFPLAPSKAQQVEAEKLVESVANFYPCRPCAEDFQVYVAENKVDASSREALSLWMCDAHNAVNTKLGKPVFDCRYWQQRWREGWDDFVRSQK